jgi:Ca2+/Na+ antiporter
MLYDGADAIGEGSELLLLVPAFANVVGSVVLPLLGAVPDGLMVLFSGFGPNASETIQVGVGALAGSTIMLLTLPWFASIYAGRVDIVNCEPQYKRPRTAPPGWAKLKGTGVFDTGVGVGKEIGSNAKLMLATGMLYMCVQIPAFMYGDLPQEEQAKMENKFAGIGSILCFIAFFLYMWKQFQDGEDDPSDLVSDKRIDAIKNGELNLCGAMEGMLIEYTKSGDLSPDTCLLDISEHHPMRKQLRKVLARFFAYYDINRDHRIDQDELRLILKDLHEDTPNAEITQLFSKCDVDGSGFIEFDEFITLMLDYLSTHLRSPKPSGSKDASRRTLCYVDDDDEECGDEEEDIPEDLLDMSPEQQQARIRHRAFTTMGWGLFLVTAFSDPMVDCFSEWGKRLDISAFYVSFILAPVASNAAEILSSYNYSLKKTQKSMTIALCTLEGAACMNNTFCLGIFFFLIWYNEFPWTYTAETFSILICEVVIGMTATKRVTRYYAAFLILGLYPLSLIFVWTMENIFGLT